MESENPPIQTFKPLPRPTKLLGTFNFNTGEYT